MTPPANQATLDLHIGTEPPSRWDEIDHIRATVNPKAWGDQPRPQITSEAIDWETIGLTPRWVGDDSSQCVAAVEPNRFAGHGAQEWGRFLDGALGRGEIALVVSMLRPTPGPYRAMYGPRAAVSLTGADWTSVGGPEVPLATNPELAPDLSRADRDLALRLRTRPSGLPWWALKLSVPAPDQRWGGFGDPEGALVPLLVSVSGEIVAAVWTRADGAIRHYILPFMPTYRSILEWLVDQAVPEYVPSAARRVRGSLTGWPELQTAKEAFATHDLTQFEAEVERRGTELREALAVASREADEVRDPLLYGSDAVLVRAVSRVLSDAAIEVVDLDEEFGDSVSADLLVTYAGRRMLVEIKSATGNPGERLVDDATRHLQTWPNLRPVVSVEGVVLVLNYQTKTHPLDRWQSPYQRREFLTSLAIPVVSSRQLFDWWRLGDFKALRDALFP